MSDTLGRVFAVVDELVFADANAKDATAVQAYKHIAGIDKVKRRREERGEERGENGVRSEEEVLYCSLLAGREQVVFFCFLFYIYLFKYLSYHSEFQETGEHDRGDRADEEQRAEPRCEDRTDTTEDQQLEHRKSREGSGRGEGGEPDPTGKTEETRGCLKRKRVVYLLLTKLASCPEKEEDSLSMLYLLFIKVNDCEKKFD